jgi:class 3 adenylate cyclase
VNKELIDQGIQPVRARIGIDMGQILISRIGVPNGSSSHDRNSLTAVGPAANLASKLQGMAGVNEVWVGDTVRRYASPERISNFDCVTPSNWTWNYGGNPNNPYHCWRYNGRVDPLGTLLDPTPLYL